MRSKSYLRTTFVNQTKKKKMYLKIPFSSFFCFWKMISTNFLKIENLKFYRKILPKIFKNPIFPDILRTTPKSKTLPK